MGNERDLLKARGGTLVSSSTSATPGKHSGTEHLPPAAGPPSKSGIWGAYAPVGTACDREPAQIGCFLPADQRARTIPTYQSRVTAAENQYGLAIISVEIDERLKKEPEKSDLFAKLLLKVIGLVTTSAVESAISMAIEHADEAEHVLALVRPILDTSKEGISEKVTAHDGGAARPANVLFLDYLKSQSALVYQRFREDLLAVANDVMFSILFNAFRAELHSEDKYKAEIEGALSRFEASNIGKMGISKNPEATALDSIPNMSDRPTHLDRCAFWVDTPMGPRLAMYTRGHVIPKDADYATDLDKGSVGGGIGTDEASLANADWKFDTYVADEFTGVAISMHTSTWGAPPMHRPFGYEEMLGLGAKAP